MSDMKDEALYCTYRLYASGRPRPMKDSMNLSAVSITAQEFSTKDPTGAYEVRGVVLHPEGREEVLECWADGERMRHGA